ncbi:MAG: hypothetical protein LH628_06330 [Microcoleus sp. CAN_BIN18]|nr:hypothetical protein [Microcoleus sp. CAN_BIN18]
MNFYKNFTPTAACYNCYENIAVFKLLVVILLWKFCRNYKLKVLAMSTFKNRIDTRNIKFVLMANRAKIDQKQQGRSIFSAINQSWQFFLSFAAGGDELKIWQTSDRNGNTYWHGCDRATGRYTCVATDDQMRAWIDRRYCQ